MHISKGKAGEGQEGDALLWVDRCKTRDVAVLGSCNGQVTARCPVFLSIPHTRIVCVHARAPVGAWGCV